MSSSDSRQTRYANTNANARRPGNWGSDPAREYRPIGQRYGSVLVLSGPKVSISRLGFDMCVSVFGAYVVFGPAPLGNSMASLPQPAALLDF